MSYPHYQSTLHGWGSNQLQFGRPPPIQFQPQSSWGGYDYFRAHAPHIDPAIFNQVYGRISNSDMTPVGVGINEARIWHRRAYGGLCAINALTPQEIGYASAYEAHRIWIHNYVLYEPFRAEIERQREAFIGIAIAEAIRMHMISRPIDVDGCMPACEAAAATASHIFDENMSCPAGGDVGRGAGMGYDSKMDVGAYGSGFGTPGMTGSGMAGGIDPHAIDHDAPYFNQSTGRHSRLSMPSPFDPTRAHSSREGTVMRGNSPYLAAAPSMGVGASPGIYGGKSPLLAGGNGMGIAKTHGGVFSPHGAGSSPYGGASPVHVPPIYGASSPYTSSPSVTTVSAYPGSTTVIQMPRRRHRSSSRHHKHHNRRARSAEPDIHTYANPMGSPGGPGGFVGGAVGGLARGTASSFYGSPNKGYGYPGHGGIYR